MPLRKRHIACGLGGHWDDLGIQRFRYSYHPPIDPSIHPSIYQPYHLASTKLHPSTHSSMYPHIHVCIVSSIHLSIFLFALMMFIFLSILSISTPIYLAPALSFAIFPCLSSYLSSIRLYLPVNGSVVYWIYPSGHQSINLSR